jgi:hypothetical protein
MLPGQAPMEVVIYNNKGEVVDRSSSLIALQANSSTFDDYSSEFFED